MSWTAIAHLVIDHSQVPATQTDYPLTVALTDNDLRTTANGGKVAHASAYDVQAFADADCTLRLAAERVQYDGAAGAWLGSVRLPALSATADTDVYLGVGDAGISTDPNADATYGRTAVWDADFYAVHHLGDGTTLDLTDSSSGARNGTLVGTPTAAPGQLGGGLAVSQNNRYSLPSPTATRITASCWWKAGTLASNYNKAIADYNGDFMLGIRNNTANQIRFVATIASVGIKTVDSSPAYNVNDGAWHLITGIFDGAALLLYADGALRGSLAQTGNLSSSGNACHVGADPGGGNYCTGTVDEVRLSTAARSAEWHACEWANGSHPGNFGDPGFYTAAWLPTGGTVHALAGAATGTSSATATLTALHPLAGATAGTSAATATLTARHPLAGTTPGSSTAAGTLTATRRLTATATAASSAAATLTRRYALAGAASGSSYHDRRPHPAPRAALPLDPARCFAVARGNPHVFRAPCETRCFLVE